MRDVPYRRAVATSSRRLFPAIGVAAVLWLPGCGSGVLGADDVPPPGSPLPSPAAAATASTAPTPGATTAARPLPADCGELVSFATVLDALSVPLEGDPSYVYAGPLADSGRTGRVTCSYGGSPDGGPPVLSVTVNGYLDAQTAGDRLDATVGQARSAGQSVASLDLDGRPGVLLVDSEDTSYVIADAERTLVVTLRTGVVPEPATRVVLLAVAGAALGVAPPELP